MNLFKIDRAKLFLDIIIAYYDAPLITTINKLH